MSEKASSADGIGRRNFLGGCAAAALTSADAAKVWSTGSHGLIHATAARRTMPLNRGSLFGGKLHPGATAPAFNAAAFARIDLPHTVAPLSWQKWNPAAWEDVWIYRRHFSLPPAWRGLRLFAYCERVMTGATLVINDHVLEQHLGGFLPFEREITGLTRENDNVLAIEVDSRWLNVPPSGSPRGPVAVDYLMPGGITGAVTLRAMPKTLIREVYAKPVSVLSSDPRVEILCRIDASGHLPVRARLRTVLKKHDRIISTVSHSSQIERPDEEIRFTMDRLSGIQLWAVEHPQLYLLEATLFLDERPLHSYSTPVGFREECFELNGF